MGRSPVMPFRATAVVSHGSGPGSSLLGLGAGTPRELLDQGDLQAAVRLRARQRPVDGPPELGDLAVAVRHLLATALCGSCNGHRMIFPSATLNASADDFLT